jgi:hypothetical protein
MRGGNPRRSAFGQIRMALMFSKYCAEARWDEMLNDISLNTISACHRALSRPRWSNSSDRSAAG